eukprot:TRINITY_DN12324_c0_g1_i2.p1 TRINITY_DN12324_c0_g1~~TRINITY_DN12324_c0_g1_i2.p1  ORF type:complete len:166 (-),score=34.86 TRINITY_DN12324_c0_g1_i2:126-623(-)
MPFWQLAEGEKSFCVAVLGVEPALTQSPIESSITVYVQHDISGISAAIQLPPTSTLLQLKIAAFEQLRLGDTAAALDPRVHLSLGGVVLDNQASLHTAHVSSGHRLFIGMHSPCSSRRPSRTSSPDSEEHTIENIWSNSDSSEDEGLALPPVSYTHLTLPTKRIV